MTTSEPAANGDGSASSIEAPDDENGSRPARLRALGAEIRARRGQRQLSTVALARSCGVSASLISQVERGLTAPSLDVLWAIARVLEAPIGAFFDDTGAASAMRPVAATGRNGPAGRGVVVVRASGRKRLGVTASLTYQLLSPDLQHRLELIWIELGPGEAGPAEPFAHPGEEQVVVIRGEVHISVGDEVWVLGAGDAITFDSASPHRAMNRGASPALVIAAITPPSF